MSKKMSTQDAPHEELVKSLYDQMKTVLEGSEQPIFIYLDDNHKACNNKFAALLGFKSPQEWANSKKEKTRMLCRQRITGIRFF